MFLKPKRLEERVEIGDLKGYNLKFVHYFMRATFDGQDYLITLEQKSQDFQKLQQEKLEASLTELFTYKNLNKMLSLELTENNAIDGIELKHLPDSAESWEAIQIIQVKVNKRAYNYIRERGQFGTRYNGSDKIEIIN